MTARGSYALYIGSNDNEKGCVMDVDIRWCASSGVAMPDPGCLRSFVAAI